MIGKADMSKFVTPKSKAADALAEYYEEIGKLEVGEWAIFDSEAPDELERTLRRSVSKRVEYKGRFVVGRVEGQVAVVRSV